MEEKRRLKEEIESVTNLQFLVTAYEEISTIRMRLARGSVLASRDFLSALLAIFVNVKSAYKKLLLEKQQKHKKDNMPIRFSTLPTNGKHVLILLSANTKLYGEIIAKVFDEFKQHCLEENTDLVIVGRVGKEMYETSGIKKPYAYFEIADSEKDFNHLKPLFQFILPYESVTVFYGRFVNIITQTAEMINISGEESLPKEQKEEKEYGFLFEPPLEQVLNFFETEIYLSLFTQTIHEAELARYGSRIKAMEQGMVYINERLIHLLREQKRYNRMLMNKEQQERLAGIRLWQR